MGLRISGRLNYPLLGSLLALGAPCGLLLAHSLATGALPTPAWIVDEISTQRLTYSYVTFSSLLLLAALGYHLGRKSDYLRQLSNTDPLTGLHNRRRFNERLEDEMNRSHRYQVPLSMMAIDLDHLKTINDNFGHKAGDNALLAVAGGLLRSLRAIDIVARIGGDEFAVLLPQTTAAEAGRQATRLMKNLTRQHFSWLKSLSVSIGVAEFDSTLKVSIRGDEFLLAADTALYQAKAGGGAQTIVAKSKQVMSNDAAIPSFTTLKLPLTAPA